MPQELTDDKSTVFTYITSIVMESGQSIIMPGVCNEENAL